MTSVYVCDVEVETRSVTFLEYRVVDPETLAEELVSVTENRSFMRPLVPSTMTWASLMVDTTKLKAMVASPQDGVTGTGMISILTGSSWDDLRNVQGKTTLTNARRNQFNNWLTNAGYLPIPAALTEWIDVIHFVARQVNEGADLYETFVAS
jgi:hypothetical protein